MRQSAAFSQEIQRALEWIAQQPDLAVYYNQHRRRILGGAYRLQARYYLDGGQPAAALQYYRRALLASARYALRHTHRMAYALLELVGLKKLAQSSLRRASARQKLQNVQISELALISGGQEHRKADLNSDSHWPGIRLSGSR